MPPQKGGTQTQTKILINLTNHPSAAWSREQTEAAQAYGQPLDFPFPAVPAEADEMAIGQLAEKLLEQITALQPAAVLCQGEFTLSYRIICGLKARNIPVLAACCDRCCEEIVHSGGTTEKRVVFRFARFRQY